MNIASVVEFSGRLCFWFVVTALFVALLVEAAFSFSAPKTADVSFLYYLAWLVDKHNIAPYLQLYDTSFPGTFIFHILIAQLFGYSDTGYHWTDIAFLSLLLLATWLLLAPLHTRVAAAAVVAVGLYYFVGTNDSMRFQRDYIALLPVVMSLVLVQRWSVQRWKVQRGWGQRWLCFLGIGFLFSLSASIKPHFAVGLPAVIAYALCLHSDPENRSLGYRSLLAMLWTLAGFVLWMLLCALWLLQQGALSAFFSMTTQYLPVYMNMDSGQTATADGNYHWPFLLTIMADAKWRWLTAAVAAAWALVMNRSRRQDLALCLTLLTLCTLYVLYVFIGGKNWDYHWMPFIYFQIVCSSLLLNPIKETQRSWKGRIAMCCLVALFFYSIKFFYKINISPTSTHQRLVRVQNEFPAFPYEESATVELVTYLKTRTQPGDKIAFRKDGSYGPVFPALLQLQLLPATHFPLQTMLYRATDTPYIFSLRQQLLEQTASLPTFAIDDGQFPPEGKGSFPAYDSFINEHYEWRYDNISTHQIPYYFAVYERKK